MQKKSFTHKIDLENNTETLLPEKASVLDT